MTLRGPGNNTTGYCAVGETVKLTNLGIADAGTAYSMRAQRSGNPDANLQTALGDSKRRTRVTVYPPADGASKPRVTVQMDFGDGFVMVLDREMDKTIPDTIRFGLLGATGGSSDAHLISDLRVGTVKTPPQLDLTKTISQETDGVYNLGDTIQYRFLVENNGDAALYNLTLIDPRASNISCPEQKLAELKSGDYVVCTASHTID